MFAICRNCFLMPDGQCDACAAIDAASETLHIRRYAEAIAAGSVERESTTVAATYDGWLAARRDWCVARQATIYAEAVLDSAIAAS